MSDLENSSPEIHQEFLDGNWVINKNIVPFCSIGGDHGLEQMIKIMKITGGIVGITLNPNALARFFLIAPEISRILDATTNLQSKVSK